MSKDPKVISHVSLNLPKGFDRRYRFIQMRLMEFMNSGVLSWDDKARVAEAMHTNHLKYEQRYDEMHHAHNMWETIVKQNQWKPTEYSNGYEFTGTHPIEIKTKYFVFQVKPGDIWHFYEGQVDKIKNVYEEKRKED